MLRCRRLAATLYLGVDIQRAGGVAAHAWLQSVGTTLTGAAGHERFGVMAQLGGTPPPHYTSWATGETD